MSGVDVLAVMQWCSEWLTDCRYHEHANKLQQSRAAVAELIEADKEFDAALSAYRDAEPDGLGATFNLSEDHPAVIRLREAGSRRRAALARVQGGA
jgi:hypothetical protein